MWRQWLVQLLLPDGMLVCLDFSFPFTLGFLIPSTLFSLTFLSLKLLSLIMSFACDYVTINSLTVWRASSFDLEVTDLISSSSVTITALTRLVTSLLMFEVTASCASSPSVTMRSIPRVILSFSEWEVVRSFTTFLLTLNHYLQQLPIFESSR